MIAERVGGEVHARMIGERLIAHDHVAVGVLHRASCDVDRWLSGRAGDQHGGEQGEANHAAAALHPVFHRRAAAKLARPFTRRLRNLRALCVR